MQSWYRIDFSCINKYINILLFGTRKREETDIRKKKYSIRIPFFHQIKSIEINFNTGSMSQGDHILAVSQNKKSIPETKCECWFGRIRMKKSAIDFFSSNEKACLFIAN